MKKKQLVSLSLIAGLAASTIVTGGTVTAQPAQGEAAQAAEAAVPNGDNTFFSGIELAPEAIEALQAQGKQGSALVQPEPKGLDKIEKKKKFDRAALEGPLPTGPVSGEQNTLAVLVKFPTGADGKTVVPGSPNTRIPAGKFKDLLFGTSYNPYDFKEGDVDFTKYATFNGEKAPTDRTLYNYYQEVSYGKVQVTTKNEPVWVEAPHPYEYYFGNTGSLPATESDYNANGYGDYPHNVQGLVVDVLHAVDDQVDFSQYAINGKVPGVFIIHEGTGGEFSRDPRVFWSHKWQLREKYWPTNPAADPDGVVTEPVILDGVEVDTYSMEPEIGGDTTGWSGSAYGPVPPYVGVYAHEFAHVLGLPDLYDYGYESQGVGAWSVMAGGSWTRYPNNMYYSGNTPVHLDAWNKYFAGFADVKELTPNDTLDFSLAPSSQTPTVYKVNVPHSKGTEYFLFENRQQVGYDKGLTRYGTAAHGLIAWHVDDNVLSRTFRRPNEAENFNPVRNGERMGTAPASNGEHHYGVAVIQADGKFELEKKGSGNNYGSDAFPGTLGKTSFVLSDSFYSGSFYNFPSGKASSGFFRIDNIFEKDGVVSGKFRTSQSGKLN